MPGITNGEQVDLIGFQKLVVGARVVVDTHREYLDAFALHSLLQPYQRGHLFHAGSTPGGPEIQDHDFAAKVAQAHLAVGVLDREIWRRCTDVGRFRATVAAAKDEDQRPCGKERRSHKAIINNGELNLQPRGLSLLNQKAGSSYLKVLGMTNA